MQAREDLSNAMVEVRGLTRVIRNGDRSVEILRGISFSVGKGEVVAIMGASGSGKSTLLGLLAGLDTPTGGDVLLSGVSISYMAEDKLAQIRGQQIGFVFQSYQLIPTLTALENVLLPFELNGNGEEREGVARAQALLASVGLADRMHHYPVQLSGGEQQRVALARAFINTPKILFCDEPTGNLDGDTSDSMVDLIFGLNRERATTLVLVTHNFELAGRCQRILRLRSGTVISDERTASPA